MRSSTGPSSTGAAISPPWRPRTCSSAMCASSSARSADLLPACTGQSGLRTKGVLIGTPPVQSCGDTLDLRRRTGMRRVGAWELVSLDGVMERPENWAFSYSDDEMGEASASGMARSDALRLGRITYEHMAAYWPHQPGGTPMVDYINSVPKFVLSSTLEETLEWNNSIVIVGNAAEEVAKLKRRPGKDIT